MREKIGEAEKQLKDEEIKTEKEKKELQEKIIRVNQELHQTQKDAILKLPKYLKRSNDR